jgi:TfoX/Sxy family transcriptional regulator of competence genes
MRAKASLASHVTEQLSFLGRISSRSIFGATGIFIDDRLLGIVLNDDSLYLHTGPTNRDDYVSRGMPQFKPYPNAFDLTTDHHQVPPEVVADDAQLKVWGERALKAAIDAAKAKQLAGIERSRHAKQAKRKKAD